MPKIDIAKAVVRTTSGYPGDLKSACVGREKAVLGNLAGLTQFGVNLTRLKPGAAYQKVPTPFQAPSASARFVVPFVCSWHTIGFGTDVVPWVFSFTSASNETRYVPAATVAV